MMGANEIKRKMVDHTFTKPRGESRHDLTRIGGWMVGSTVQRM